MTQINTINRIPEVINQIEATLKERMNDAVYAVQNNAQDLILTPKHGAVYTTYFYTDKSGKVRPGRARWKPHQASAPGEPFATDTGQTLQNITVNVTEDGRTGFVGVREGIQSEDNKTTVGQVAEWLELGNSKIEPRPWLKPAFEMSLEEIKKIFQEDFGSLSIKYGGS